MNPQLEHADAVTQLKTLGFQYAHYIKTEGQGRMPALGKAVSNTDAWYKWSDNNNEVLHYCDYANNTKGTIFPSNGKRLSISESSRQIKQIKLRQQEAQAAREATQEQAAQLARNTFKEATSEGSHPYIELKGLTGLHNAKVNKANGQLLIPMWVHGVGIVNVQRIYPDYKKLFLNGAQVKGAYSVIGSLDAADKILLTEGWATGCTLHEQQSLPVVVALSVGNLLPVAQVVRKQFPDAQVIVCMDDDRQSKRNIGKAKAIEAAKAIGAKVAIPELCKACRCTDFNDAYLCSQRRSHG